MNNLLAYFPENIATTLKVISPAPVVPLSGSGVGQNTGTIMTEYNLT